jgi:Uncharacterised nucleotidyltransferase
LAPPSQGRGSIPPTRVDAYLRLKLDAATVEVARALAAAELRAILIKGAATAARLYDHRAERSYRDIDLLIDARSAQAVQRTLQRLGFCDRLAGARGDEQMLHASIWDRAVPVPVTIDLHTSFYWREDEPAAVWSELSRGTRWIDVMGTPVEVLGDPALALVIAGHVVQHPAEPTPLEDLRRGLERIDRNAWLEAAAMAKRLGAASVLVAGLARVPAGAWLREELGPQADASPAVQLKLAGAPPASKGFMRLAEARTPMAKLALIAHEFVPTPAFMRANDAIARRGRAGLMLAYIRRPLMLAYQAPAGWRAWRATARRQAQSGTP